MTATKQKNTAKRAGRTSSPTPREIYSESLAACALAGVPAAIDALWQFEPMDLPGLGADVCAAIHGLVGERLVGVDIDACDDPDGLKYTCFSGVDLTTIYDWLQSHGPRSADCDYANLANLANHAALAPVDPDLIAVWREALRSAAYAAYECEFYREKLEACLNGRDPARAGLVYQAAMDRLAASEVQRAKFHFIPASEVEDLPPMEWLIGGIIPLEATAAIWGKEGAGKSFVLLDMACCIATGQHWRGHPVKAVGTVAYIAGEGMKGMSLRIRAWREQHRLQKGALDHLYMIGKAPQLLQPDDLNALLQALRALPETPALVVIDTLARCTAGADENLQREMTLLVQAMDTIKGEFGAQVITAHHANATGDRMRGSTVLPGAFETIIKVSQETEGLAQIECQKQKDGAAKFTPIALRLKQVCFPEHPDLTTCILATADPAEVETSKLKVKKELLELLYKQGASGASSSKWEEAAKIVYAMKHGTFNTYRNNLLNEEYVSKGQGLRGPYQITAKGLALIGKPEQESPKRSKPSENVHERSEDYAQTPAENVHNVQSAISTEHMNIPANGATPDLDIDLPLPDDDERPTGARLRAIDRWQVDPTPDGAVAAPTLSEMRDAIRAWARAHNWQKRGRYGGTEQVWAYDLMCMSSAEIHALYRQNPA